MASFWQRLVKSLISFILIKDLSTKLKECIQKGLVLLKFINKSIITLQKETIIRKMPQLPQVETVRKFLTEVLIKPKPKKIKSIHTYYPPIIKQPEPSEFVKILVGQSFQQIDRYGKHLILKLKTHSIISHLRMEGKYNFYTQRPQIGKHDHIQFVMTDGSSLVFSDVRKFGTMHLVKKGKQMEHKSLAKLGPQANQQEFTTQHLEKVCKKKTTSIKQILLNQENVCGIGNIYVDQILFAAGIHPQTSGRSISSERLQKVVEQSKYILDKAIINKGTTFRSFSSNHQSGQFQNCLKVYDRGGEKCQNCNNTIQKIKVGGRGTHYCPKCQLKCN